MQSRSMVESKVHFFVGLVEPVGQAQICTDSVLICTYLYLIKTVSSALLTGIQCSRFSEEWLLPRLSTAGVL